MQTDKANIRAHEYELGHSDWELKRLETQAKLVNPEKSLVATIASGHRGGPEQSFRYAPLSSGLDIVLMVAERKYRPEYCGTIAMA